jgi:hypothetical protein
MADKKVSGVAASKYAATPEKDKRPPRIEPSGAF